MLHSPSTVVTKSSPCLVLPSGRVETPAAAPVAKMALRVVPLMSLRMVLLVPLLVVLPKSPLPVPPRSLLPVLAVLPMSLPPVLVPSEARMMPVRTLATLLASSAPACTSSAVAPGGLARLAAPPEAARRVTTGTRNASKRERRCQAHSSAPFHFTVHNSFSPTIDAELGFLLFDRGRT